MSTSGQKFVARNRAPRVQIEYDVELYGAEKQIQLPFVMGVMADLAGKSDLPVPAVADRKFLEIDVDNFDARMRAIQPRATFAVPNTLTGQGNLPVDLSFNSIDDFSPAAVARKVPALKTLLAARTRLQHLTTYMDGKSGTEELIARLIADPEALCAMCDSLPAETPDQTDAILAALNEDKSTADNPQDDLDTLVSQTADASEDDMLDLLEEDSDTTDAELDDFPADMGADGDKPAEDSDPFGILTTPQPEDRDAPQKKFRIAILGDFTGRAARGALETGDALAARKPIKFDVDTIDDVIARFATTLVLPIGRDGAGIEVPLRTLDDLHPDELYENVSLFEELAALRQRVARGDGAQAIAELQDWAEAFGDLNLTPKPRARGATVPADRRLSDFGALIGDMTGNLRSASPAQALIGRIVGPFVQTAPDPAQPAMLAAVDAAISGAMSAILHHPDFQALESTWRALDLMARRIPTGAALDIVLYDVSAEEWAADLSAQEDLGESGLFRLLAEEPRLDAAQGPLSAVFGLYTLEETPPHAQLMARMAKICNWMNAPFLAAISPKFLEVPKHERNPLVAQAWDALRALPEASFVGLAAPRFLLRLPYGTKTDPVEPFDYEEFTLREGLKGMLWANPVVLSAILMAETATQGGKDMQLGTVMSAGDMPFHYMTDQYGDQIALPCTERLLTTRTMAEVVARGYIPLLSIKGRNEVRQGSFQGLGPGMLAGPWGQAQNETAQPHTTDAAIDGTLTPTAPSSDTGTDDPADDPENEDLDGFGDLDFDLDDDDGGDALGLDPESAEDEDDLDALLAGFGDDEDGTGDDLDEDMDEDLAALLEGL
ncbi:type VI secretion system contractile sheath small subunit [Thalassobius sp. S69A]|uniref:type VI secretion system contractile sheath small subunit n=1 Tax=Thalassobius sp. S69A TaxID=3450125 RepID=UPI0040569B9D